MAAEDTAVAAKNCRRESLLRDIASSPCEPVHCGALKQLLFFAFVCRTRRNSELPTARIFVFYYLNRIADLCRESKPPLQLKLRLAPTSRPLDESLCGAMATCAPCCDRWPHSALHTIAMRHEGRDWKRQGDSRSFDRMVGQSRVPYRGGIRRCEPAADHPVNEILFGGRKCASSEAGDFKSCRLLE